MSAGPTVPWLNRVSRNGTVPDVDVPSATGVVTWVVLMRPVPRPGVARGDCSGGRFTTLIGKGYTLFMVRHGSSPYFKVPDAVEDVRRAVRGRLAQRLHPAGAVHLDKMAETLDIFTLEAAAAQRARTRKPDPVLAVLPFDNESYAAELNYFSDGVAGLS